MKLPKPGVAADDLKCKVCQKTAKQQPDDISECKNEKCPYKEVADTMKKQGE